jgi:hypothetical protein
MTVQLITDMMSKSSESNIKHTCILLSLFFYHFGSAKNNIKFRLFCPFLTIPLRIIYSSVLDYPDIPLTDGRMVTLLYSKGLQSIMGCSYLRLSVRKSGEFLWMISQRLLDTLHATNRDLYPAIYSIISILLTTPDYLL